MFSLLNAFDKKPDHPMFDMKEARKLLVDLPKNNAFKALEEAAFWLTSIKDAQGFHPEDRANIVMLLDETAQPLSEAVAPSSPKPTRLPMPWFTLTRSMSSTSARKENWRGH